MNSFIIQLIGAIACLFIIISYYQKSKKKILLMQIVAYVLFIVHYYLLSGVSGAICNFIGLLALLGMYLFDKYNLKYKNVLASFFIFLTVVVNAITYQNIYSFLPIIAISVVIISFLFDDENFIRKMGLISTSCWLIYAIEYKSYISIIFNAIILISTVIALQKYKKLKR